MATETDIPLYTTTLASPASSVVISVPSQAYTNLKLVVTGSHDGVGSSINQWRMQFNGDSTSGLYSDTNLYGNGTNALSNRDSNQNIIYCGLIGQNSTAYNPVSTFMIMNYSDSTKNKTVVARGSAANDAVYATTGLWRNNAAITTITLFMTGQNIKAGSTFSLYGIGTGVNSTGAKATGGLISFDDTYVYHTFTSSGTFTPSQSLSADVLVVAGGGGGGSDDGGGGGAGNVAYQSARSLSSGVGLTCTIGGGGTRANGGANGTAGYPGTDSSFDTITALGGGFGGGGSYAANSYAGGNGGSGGGGSYRGTGGSGNTTSSGGATRYGNSGGTSVSTSPYPCGGGGGAGSAGGNASGSTAGAGGAGLNTWSSWLTATGVGVNGYIAGGGAGSVASGGTGGIGGAGGGGNGCIGNTNATDGLMNSGGGGGGGLNATGSGLAGFGGSGVVIVRYLKA